MKKRILTGYQPSGKLTLGNYLGSIKNLVKLQNDYETFVSIVNLHSITIPQEKANLKKWTLDLAKMLIACGVDVSKSTLFVQSDVLEISQMGWIITCHTSMDELKNMTQFKDKSAQGIKMENNTKMVPTGLFVYPPLMAADILAFGAELIPVGEDQNQHIELTSSIAKRINNKYGDIFKVPKGFFTKSSSRVMSLTAPTKKMSKSDVNTKSYILLSDAPNVAKKKINSALTDSENKVYYDSKNKPGVSNLIEIYSAINGISIKAAENQLKKLNYKDFKELVGNSVALLLKEIQSKYQKLDDKKIQSILDQGAKKATLVANKTLNKLKNKTGVNYVKK